MRAIFPALAAVLLTPLLLAAQVRAPEARAVPAGQRPARAELGRACELSAGDGLTMAFAVCPPPGDGGVGKEVEVVEYRNGDSPMRVTRVSVRGVLHRELAVRHLGWSDPDDDSDGVPDLMENATRRAGGRMKVGRVTLRRTSVARADRAVLPWEGGDLDGDGFPLNVDLQDTSGGTATVAFEGCRAVSDAEKAADAVTLACREVRMVAALDANPYARFIAQAADRPEVHSTLLDRRTPPGAVASARDADTAKDRRTPRDAGTPRSGRTARLEGARLEGWSLDFDPALGGSGQWTLEVRVERIEMS